MTEDIIPNEETKLNGNHTSYATLPQEEKQKLYLDSNQISTEWPSMHSMEGKEEINDKEEVLLKSPLKKTNSIDREFLDPEHASPLRKSNLLVATFNLVATIVGGGVLSLPLAFEKAGIVNATILMIVAGVFTDFSLYLLCSCARRTGARSFAEVARIAFGPSCELFQICLLFVFLMFVIIAFMVLVRDIWTPIFNREGNEVLFGILVLLIPFLLKKDLHGLRYNCYVGFTSISVLCCALLKRAYDVTFASAGGGEGYAVVNDPIKYTHSNFRDILYAFSIITLSFLSSFNIISVHAALINPTRERVRFVIHAAVCSCFMLTYLFALGGYYYARSGVRGNILLNFDASDKLILAGRIGCGITCALALPIMTLPCREALFGFLEQFKSTEEERQEPCSNMQHILSTFLLTMFCFTCAVYAPGVATVWSLCGSSMGFLIAFTLPTLFYIKIRMKRVGFWSRRILLAVFIFVFSIIGGIACTIQTIWRTFFSNLNVD